jgi:hypothetical protein
VLTRVEDNIGERLRHAGPGLAEVRRAEPDVALGVAGRVITGTCLQSCARGDRPDQAAWARLAGELSAMAAAYLLTGDPG